MEVTTVAPMRLVAVNASTTRDGISAAIREGLDRVWADLRARRLTPGHNVVLYRGGPGDMTIGVQCDDGGDVEVPGGRVARTTHVGGYDRLGETWDALNAWCAANGHVPSGTFWEVYGDWAEDPDELETELVHLLAD